VRTFIFQILQAVVLQAKKLGKAVYVFSVDSEGGKVIHVNHVPESLRSKGFDSRTWAARVTKILGGKVHTLLYESSDSI
jgi:alanyl-tRNA synthetase